MKAMLRVGGAEVIARSLAGLALMIARESQTTPTEGMPTSNETTTSSSACVEVKLAEFEPGAPGRRCSAGGNTELGHFKSATPGKGPAPIASISKLLNNGSPALVRPRRVEDRPIRGPGFCAGFAAACGNAANR
jgi:hypothetical protein